MNMDLLKESVRKRGHSGRKLTLAVIALAAVVALLLGLLRPHGGASGDEELNMPRNYVYTSATASNRMELHVLRTRPSNVTLASIHNNVTISPYYGVNGGFFYQDALLSIAVVN